MAEYKVSVSELKAHLSFYIKQTQNGHTIIITLRGKLIAQLTAIKDDVSERAKNLDDETLPQE